MNKKLDLIMNYTSIEQSKKLLELGLDKSTADMAYLDETSLYPKLNCDGMLFLEKGEVTISSPISCWSVGALLELLPSEISTCAKWQDKYQIDIRKYDYDKTFYQIAYGNSRGSSGSWHDMINTGHRDNLLDVCFEMICWLLANGYIKKGD